VPSADLRRHSWRYVARRTVHEFSKDDCTDLAAALTYYAVLSLFPALIALLSLLGLVGNGPKTVSTLLGILSDAGASSLASNLRGPLTSLSQTPAAGPTFVIGLIAALWSASGYVGAFGRAMNRIYAVREGRPAWKLRPVMLLTTLLAVLLVAVVGTALVISGPVAQSLGGAIGLSSAAVLAWQIVKWPVLLFAVVLIVALLYYATPNVRQPRFRWMSIGALVAVVVWLVASVAFGFYVANFSSYNATYGSLAGAIVLLLWLWITNLALLFGAEFDAELTRVRQLQAGVRAEKLVRLEPRDTRKVEKAASTRDLDMTQGRRLREAHGRLRRARTRGSGEGDS
jgi:membrane protein